MRQRVSELVNNVESAIDTVGNTLQTVAGIPGEALEGLKACNPFADECTPPLAVIFGGGTVAATANTIINQSGRILGVDLNGSEVLNRVYNSVPSINIKSNCGQGGGASGKVRLNSDGSISKVIIVKSGVNFPPAPDGSVGGNGGIFCAGDNCIIRTPDGDNQSFVPGRDVTTIPGSLIYIPKGSSIVFPDGTLDEEGNDASGLQPGRGLTVPNGFDVPVEFSFRTPTPELDDDIDADIAYPVIMELDEIDLTRSGISYNNGDTITVSGDGNELTYNPILSVNGSIIGVQIPDGDRGQGFTSIPDVTINTSTGAGAQLTPILRVKYRGRDSINEVIDSVTQDQIISVVDCVGKFNV